MKRVLKSLLLVVSMFLFIGSVSAKSKINVYLFRLEGCGHCAAEMTYLDKIYNDYKDKINIVTYEVQSGNNAQLVLDVGAAVEYDIDGYPFTLIGDQYMVGFGEGVSESQLKQLIDTQYDAQPDDIVEGLLDENVYSNLKKTDLFEAMEAEGLKITSKKSKQNNILPIIVFSSIIVGIGALVYYSRKK
ncbi:MAG: hypothetical protein IKX00_00160 [Bacilli bacterium]|nr:hypothetical protein [Bacilli bacterium]